MQALITELLPRKPASTTVAVLEALRDARVDREILRLPRRIGTEAAKLVNGVLKSAGGSWEPEINEYQFATAAVSVPQRILGDSGTSKESAGTV